jgi:hypothetical protein
MACPRVTRPLARKSPPEQTLANVLAVLFAATPHGKLFGAQNGNARLHDMQIYLGDAAQAELIKASKVLLSN